MLENVQGKTMLKKKRKEREREKRFCIRISQRNYCKCVFRARREKEIRFRCR